MKIIKPSVEEFIQGGGFEGILKHIERCGRLCYKSEDRITEGSAEKFVNMLKTKSHCYDGDTEILTNNGWVKFKNYKHEDVAVINKDLSFKGFEKPKNIINHEYDGNFYYYPSLGIEVTDGHNMFGVFRTSQNDFYNNENYELFKCSDKYKDSNGKEKTLGERMFKSPSCCLKPSTTNPYGELIGFWLGDGCHTETLKNVLCFHLRKKRKINYLKELCTSLKFELKETRKEYYYVYSDNIGYTFNNTFYNNGKIIPLNYSNNVEMIYSIIQGLINSDGTKPVNTKTITFSNASLSIMNWLSVYAPLCGYTVSPIKTSHFSKANNPIYRIFLLNSKYTINNDSRKPNSKVIITNKKNNVYCVSVSTGLIIVRGKNGVVTICGNCAMLEHGTIYLTVPEYNLRDDEGKRLEGEYQVLRMNKYTKFKYNDSDQNDMTAYITTNYRVIVENKLEGIMNKYIVYTPTKYHEKRRTFYMVCDRACSLEFVRHRVSSFSQESQRYVAYDKEKYGSEIKFIEPLFFEKDTLPYAIWMKACSDAEVAYMSLRSNGATAQEARTVLPNSTATGLIMTQFESDWEHFFMLRCAKDAHPQAQEVANMIKEKF